MPRIIDNQPTKALAKPKRPTGRPPRFTPELAAKICGLIATGSTLRAAAKTCGVGWRTVARWNIERPEFREAYERARETRTLVLGGGVHRHRRPRQGRLRQKPEDGKLEFNRESVHRAKLRVDERHWQMARLDRRLWGDRQEIDVKHDWSHLTEEERVRRAMQMLDMAEEMVNRDLEPSTFRYLFNSPGIILHLDFMVDAEGSSFAEGFDGKIVGLAHRPRVSQ